MRKSACLWWTLSQEPPVRRWVGILICLAISITMETGVSSFEAPLAKAGPFAVRDGNLFCLQQNRPRIFSKLRQFELFSLRFVYHLFPSTPPNWHPRSFLVFFLACLAARCDRIYCQLGDYIILPTTLYKNLKNPLRRILFRLWIPIPMHHIYYTQGI